MKPQLARTLGPKFNQYPCYVQPKLNGVRALYQQCEPESDGFAGIFQSRDEKLWNDSILAHIEEELTSISLNNAILDGELYVHGWRLQRINGAIAVNRKEPIPDTKEICFHVFDVVNPDLKFSERWLDMSNLLRAADLPHVKVVDTSYIHDRDQMERYFRLATAKGYEGVMLRPDGPYEFGETPHGTQKRSKFLWKYKSWEDDEFTCVGTTPGEGKASIGIGALLLAPGILDGYCSAVTYTGRTFGVGTGFDDSERIEFAKNPPIGKLVRVRYLELTADGIPFNPSFLAVLS